MAIDYTLHVGETIDQYNARIASARAAASGTTSQSGTTSSNAVNPITGKTNQQVLEESTAVAQKAAAMIGATFTPGYTPTSSDLSVGAQQAPTPTTIEQPTLSIQADVEAKKQALMSSLQAQQDRARQEAAAAQAKIDEFNAQQKAVLEEQKAALPEALQLGFEEAKQNELYVTQNFEENQKLVNELGDLLTEGNELIKQQQETTGLSAIRNPRINQTISDVNARVGVIEAVINARNGQIAQAYTMIDRVVNEAKVYRNDQLNYYTNLYNFYEGQKDTEGRKLIQLTADEKEYINAKINVLSNELAQADAVALKIKEAMADPATATIYANAGVTLNDTLESINTKLATYAYMKEVADTSNELSLNGYTQLVPGQAVPDGYESTVITDSKGNQKTWIKKIGVKDVFGSAEGGYYTLDEQGNIKNVIGGTSSGTTPTGFKNEKVELAIREAYITALGNLTSDQLKEDGEPTYEAKLDIKNTLDKAFGPTQASETAIRDLVGLQSPENAAVYKALFGKEVAPTYISTKR
jgi:hypothetical protein